MVRPQNRRKGAESSTTTQSKLWWTGLAIYLTSFVLPAIAGPVVMSGPALGYYCAFWSLFFSGGEAFSLLRGDTTIIGPAAIVSLFASGMINVFFITATVLILRGGSRWLVGIVFKTLVILMLPFCWVAFHYVNIYPIFGYYLWTGGMLLVLFTAKPPVEASSFAPTN